MPKKYYQKWEIDFLQANSAIMPIEQIAEHLGRTPCAVRSRIYKDFLPTCKNHKATIWTAERLEELKKIHKTETVKAIAEKLKISITSVRNKVTSLRLKTKEHFKHWTVTEVKQLKKLIAENYKAAQISEMIGKKIGAIYNQIYKLGLTIKEIKFQHNNQKTLPNYG